MRVLLSGATGFIGSYILQILIAQSIPVSIILRKNSNTWRIANLLNKVTVINEAEEESDMITEVVKFAPDVLINVSWFGVENKYNNDQKQLEENLKLTQKLFTIAKLTNIKSFVATGSQAEYGPRNAVLDETAPTLPSTLYGVAKLSAYHLLRTLCEKEKIRFAWLRIFSTYGPKDNPDWFVPYLISQLLNGEVPKLTKGEQQWDYLYVKDAANAIIEVAKNNNAFGVFNLGSGQINSVRYLAETIRDTINPNLSIDFGSIPYRQDQVMHLQADISRLKNEIHWQPKVDLKTGIENTIEWYKNG